MRLFVKSPLGAICLITIVCFLTGLIFNACRKLETKPSTTIPTHRDRLHQFFNIPPSTHPTVKKISETIKKQNDRGHFIENFIDDQGYLIWHKARVFPAPPNVQARLGGGSGDSTWILPIVKENTERVSGFLACLPKGGDSVLFRLFDATTYRYHFGDTDSAGIEAKTLAMLTMSLEQSVFGHEVFKILDTALLDDDHGNQVRYVKLQEPQARVVLLATWYVCYTVWVVDNEGQVVGCPPGDETCNDGQSELICETYNVWGFDDLDEGHGGGSGSGGWGTGGGGDINGGWTNPCREIETIPGTYTGTACESGGPLGWVSYDFEDENDFNPLDYDSVRISDDLRDSFPCIAALIEDTLFDINRKVQISMYDHFTVNQYNHTYFKVDWTMNCGSGPVAFTDHFGTGSTVVCIVIGLTRYG